MRLYKDDPKYDNFKLELWLMHSIEYYVGFLDDYAQKLASFNLQGTPNARKRIK